MIVIHATNNQPDAFCYGIRGACEEENAAHGANVKTVMASSRQPFHFPTRISACRKGGQFCAHFVPQGGALSRRRRRNSPSFLVESASSWRASVVSDDIQTLVIQLS